MDSTWTGCVILKSHKDTKTNIHLYRDNGHFYDYWLSIYLENKLFKKVKGNHNYIQLC